METKRTKPEADPREARRAAQLKANLKRRKAGAGAAHGPQGEADTSAPEKPAP